MIISPYKGRGGYFPAKVKVYRNLHRDQWSIVACDGPHKGLVVAHADELWIRWASFKVSSAGRERAIREGRKNVHAWIIGAAVFVGPPATARTRITYSPFKQDGFRLVGFDGNLISASLVHLDRAGAAWSVHPLDLGHPSMGR